MEEIRTPKQKRAIEKKDKIIETGFNLICKNGYHNTNTKEIAKESNVSTGIIYQYFNDKHDILMEGLNRYGNEIFYPVKNLSKKSFKKEEFSKVIEQMINEYLKNHKLSKIAHEELMAMTHSDKEIAKYYYECEIKATNEIKGYFEKNNFKDKYLFEKVHIILGLIDNLCHELTYHNHDNINYEITKKIVIETILSIFKNDLK